MKRVTRISSFRVLWLAFLSTVVLCTGVRASEMPPLSDMDEVEAISLADHDQLAADINEPDWFTWLNTESDKEPVFQAGAHIKFRQVRSYQPDLEPPALHINIGGSMPSLDLGIPHTVAAVLPPYYYIFLFRLTLF